MARINVNQSVFDQRYGYGRLDELTNKNRKAKMKLLTTGDENRCRFE